jgi:hypothetical protein
MNIKIKEFKEKQKIKLEEFKEKQKIKLEEFKEKQKNQLEEFKEKQKIKLEEFKEKQKNKLAVFKEKQKNKLAVFKEKQKIKLEEFKEKNKKVKGGNFNNDYDLYVEYIIAYLLELKYTNNNEYDPNHITYMKDKINELNNELNDDSIYNTYIQIYKNNFIRNINQLEKIDINQITMIIDTIIKEKNNIINIENNYNNRKQIKTIFDDLYKDQSPPEPSAPTYRPSPSAPTYRQEPL